MENLNFYESQKIFDVLGNTLRPGGFRLTDMTVELLGISAESSVLDIGCGMGATVNYLFEKYGIASYGIDISDKLLEMGRRAISGGSLIKGSGENIPFEDEIFDYIFAECTFSLMNDLDAVIDESRRVLKKNGVIVISDVYSRNPSELENLKTSEGGPVNSCIRGLHQLPLLEKNLSEKGFDVFKIEDHSDLLKELMVKIVFEYGSMSAFWCNSKCQNNSFQEILKKCKPGYFILFARKES